MSTVDDETTLESLPRMQTHRFEPWSVSPNVCGRCGGPPQAHPSDEWIAAHPDEVC